MRNSSIVIVIAINMFCLKSYSQDCESRLPQVLSSDQVKEFIANYNKNFRRDLSIRTKAIYINSEVILMIRDFFKADTNNIYEGIKFYFTGYPIKNIHRQRSVSQMQVSLVPTFSKDSTDDPYVLLSFIENSSIYNSKKNKLNQVRICPGECDSKLIVAMPETYLFSTQPNYTYNTQRLVFSNSDETENLGSRISSFSKEHGHELMYKQTKSVFLPKVTFERIGRFLDANSASKMIGIYFIAYNYNLPELEDPHQFTICIIPMELENGSYQPALCKYLEYINSYYVPDSKTKITKALITKYYAENHGDICPKVCHPPQ